MISRGQLNVREAAFLREYLGTNPPNAAAAYIRAYTYKGRHADCLAARLMARPAIREAIAEAVAQSKADGVGDMRERRLYLWSTIRQQIKDSPTHAERIAAIREDAILAGERRTDGTQVTIGGDVNLTVVIQALRSGSGLPAGRVIDATDDSSGGTAPSGSHKPALAGSTPAPAPITQVASRVETDRKARSEAAGTGERAAVLQPESGPPTNPHQFSVARGPLGRIRAAVHVDVS